MAKINISFVIIKHLAKKSAIKIRTECERSGMDNSSYIKNIFTFIKQFSGSKEQEQNHHEANLCN